MIKHRHPQKSSQNKPKKSMCILRLERDIQQYNQHALPVVNLTFPEDNIITTIQIRITPEKNGPSPYHSATIPFRLTFPEETYPMDPPKLKCLAKIYHPNINTTGAVCLPLLREDWQPTVTLLSIIFGIVYILNNPEPEDPLCVEVGELMGQNRQLFGKVVRYTLAGGTVKNVDYDKLINTKETY